jgi:two-component system, LuxR family, response regulator FixJ
MLDERRLQQCVFLIDDNESILDSLCAGLTDHGFQVHTYNSARAFLQIPYGDLPSVIVTDVAMPGMSGVELQAELNRLGCPIPVIFISAQSSVQQSVLAMQQGAIDFLVKPFEHEQFFKAVNRAIEIHIHRLRLTRLLSELSPRESQVFNLLIKGHCNADVVKDLRISLPTAKQYKSEVMRKFNTKSLADLIRFADLSLGIERS